MNEEVVTEPTEQPQTEERQPLPTGSLSEHEAQYAAGQKTPPVVAELEPTADEEPPAPALTAQQKRDKETGQFVEGKTRRRARSQQANADDVPRIKELTRQIRERDEELARLRNGATAAPVAGTPITPIGGNGNGHAAAVAPAAPKPGERFVLPAPPFDPEPQESDPKFGGDFTRYLAEVAGWNGRQAVRQSEFDRMVAGHEQQQRETQQKELTDFATRVDASREKHEDFDQVAFETKTPIQKESITDTFVMRDDNGPELLYYLHSHPKELDELLKMPELGQVKFLTLLSQRLSSNSPGSIGASTTSIPGARTIVLPPKPPNVVRTEAQPARGGIPTDRELSLSEHEHYFRPTKRR